MGQAVQWPRLQELTGLALFPGLNITYVAKVLANLTTLRLIKQAEALPWPMGVSKGCSDLGKQLWANSFEIMICSCRRSPSLFLSGPGYLWRLSHQSSH